MSLKGTGQGGLTVGKKAFTILLTFLFNWRQIQSVSLSFILQIFPDDGMLCEKHCVKHRKEAKTKRTVTAAATAKQKVRESNLTDNSIRKNKTLGDILNQGVDRFVH